MLIRKQRLLTPGPTPLYPPAVLAMAAAHRVVDEDPEGDQEREAEPEAGKRQPAQVEAGNQAFDGRRPFAGARCPGGGRRRLRRPFVPPRRDGHFEHCPCGA
jgi:hypothetical protein